MGENRIGMVVGEDTAHEDVPVRAEAQHFAMGGAADPDRPVVGRLGASCVAGLDRHRH
jgi:hypothetical protein